MGTTPKKQAQTAEILRRRRAGELPHQIAADMGMNLKALLGRLKTNGMRLTDEEKASPAFKAYISAARTKAANKDPRRNKGGFPTLADRNVEIIRLGRQGLTAAEIIERLKLKPRAVYVVLQQAGISASRDAVRARRTATARKNAEARPEYAYEDKIADLKLKQGRSVLWIAAHYRMSPKQVRALLTRVNGRRLRRSKADRKVPASTGAEP